MLKFLADENVRRDVVLALQKKGVDIEYARKGSKNGELFQLLIEESRIFLTHDSDFADSKRYPATKTKGIVILKFHPPVPERIIGAFYQLIKDFPSDALEGKLIYLSESGPLLPN